MPRDLHLVRGAVTVPERAGPAYIRACDPPVWRFAVLPCGAALCGTGSGLAPSRLGFSSPSGPRAPLQVVNVTGNQDICYYNFLCAHPLGNLRWGSAGVGG